MIDWLREHEDLLFWLAMSSIGTLVLAAVLLPAVVIRMPADYFLRDEERGERRGWLAWLWRIGKNVVGVVFVLAGIAMLVLPGQGLLTMLIGLLLMDFPGKRGLERRLIGRPRILAMVNRMRVRRGHPPLQLPSEGHGSDATPND